MTIKEGHRVPDATMFMMQAGRPTPVSSAELFEGKKVVLFAVPAAYSPTCSDGHLPGYVQHAAEFRAKGVDAIICLAVNDAFVLAAWAKDKGAQELQMVADGNASFTRALGLEMDASAFGLGVRSQRYAMIVEDGVVKKLNVDAPGKFDLSRAETMLAAL